MHDATEAIIALPAEDPLMLATAVLEGLRKPQGGRAQPMRPFGMPNSVGRSWTGRSPVEGRDGFQFWVSVWGHDLEAAANRFYRPREMDTGSWVKLTADMRGHAHVEALRALADEVGGFVRFTKRRTQRDGGDLHGAWESPNGECPSPGCDHAKHRLLLALGFEAAPVVERMLRSEATLAAVLDTLATEQARTAGATPRP